MGMKFYIMRKNDIITIAEFDENGIMLKYSQNIKNKELLPIYRNDDTSQLKKWWKERSIPIGQDKISYILKEKGLSQPEEFLIKNLGLSMTDYYWIKPYDSDLTWEDVNLFDNEFKDNILEMFSNDNNETPAYTPNGTLQGTLEKTWDIRGGERVLIKGNRDHLSSESINEVIASHLHKLQGFHNYTEYQLLKIKGKQYDYGCFSKAFTSKKIELVSAYGIVTSQKQSNEMSGFEHFISVSGQHGIDTEQLRMDLDYQLMTDFILSGRDRHLNNVAILRDADTLKFLKMAPIYDSGKCLFVHNSVPTNDKELLSIPTQSFMSNELGLLKLIHDRNIVDLTKLPSKSYIEEMYKKDSQIHESRIKLIAEAYERKIDMARAFQLGQDLQKVKIKIEPLFLENTSNNELEEIELD